MAKPLSCLLVTIQTESGLSQKVVDENPCMVGRSLEAAIAFTDVNISRNHLLVKNKGGKVWIEDQGSANGTYLHGKRLEPKQLIPVEPDDWIKLGNSNIKLQFFTIEKAFAAKEIDRFALSKQDHDTINNLIQGAHAEGRRLVELGKSISDETIQAAEAQARKIEQDMVKNRERILAEAQQQGLDHMEMIRGQAAQIIKDAEKKAEEAVAAIHEQAETSRKQANDYYKEAMKKADDDAERLHETAQREADHVLEEAKLEGERRVREIAEQARLEAIEEANKIKQQARDEAQDEKERLLKEVQEQIHGLRLEKKRQETELNIQIKQLETQHAQLSGSVGELSKSIEQQKSAAEAEAARTRKFAAEEAEQVTKLAKQESEALLETTKREAEALKTQRLDELQKLESKRRKETDATIKSKLRAFEEKRAELERDVDRLSAQLKEQTDSLAATRQQLKKELAEQQKILDDRRRVVEEELAHKRQLSEAQATEYAEKKRREFVEYSEKKLQEIETKRQLREQEVSVFVDQKMNEFKKARQQVEDDLSKLTSELKDLKPVVATHRSERDELKAEVAKLKDEAEKLKPILASLTEEYDVVLNTKEKRQVEVKELENRKGRLAIDVENLERQVGDVQVLLEQKLAEHKVTLEREMEKRKLAQDEQLNRLRLAEVERIRQDRMASLEQLIREREKVGKTILSTLEESIIQISSLEAWRKIAKEVEGKVFSAFEEKALSTVGEVDAISPMVAKVVRQRRQARVVWMGQGIAIGLLLLFGVQQGFNTMMADLNPMKTAAEQEARARQEDLERRKFNPPKDDELRDTYAGCVIYTRDFVSNYLQPEFQKIWLKKASTYFLKQWKVEEEKIIEVLSSINTLIKTLEEKKEAIHPDYIEDGLRKMDEFEAETLARIKDLLGSEVRVEALRRIEKRTYLEYFYERLPAKEKTD